MDQQYRDTKKTALQKIGACVDTKSFLGLEPKLEPQFEDTERNENMPEFETDVANVQSAATPQTALEFKSIVKTETLVEDRIFDFGSNSQNILAYRSVAQTTPSEFKVTHRVIPKSEPEFTHRITPKSEPEFTHRITPKSETTEESDCFLQSLDSSLDLQDSHTGRRFICHHCAEPFRSKHALRMHVILHNSAVSNIVIVDTVSLQCSDCDFVGSSKEDLTIHAATHGDSEPRIVIKKILKVKETKHTGKTSYKCSKCDYESKSSGLFKKHSKVHSNGRPFECVHCNYKFKVRSVLIRHLTIHSGEKPFKCQFCDYASNNCSNLKKHLKIHDGKPYKCQYCDHASSQNNSLKRHIMKCHAAALPYECTKCHLKFRHSSYLIRHSKLHDGRKPYACAYCDYKCRKKFNLIQHLRIHAGEKQHVCDVCGQSFTRGNGLKKHMKRFHSSDFQHECQQCGLKFKYRSHLKKHSGIHVGMVRFECDHCSSLFSTKSSLVRHMNNHKYEQATKTVT